MILFDIDYTLLNSDLIKKEQSKCLQSVLGVEAPVLDKAKQRYYEQLEDTSDFCPLEFSKLISAKFGVPCQKIIVKFFEKTKLYAESLYPETLSILEHLSSRYSLGIYSQGKNYYQTLKLKKAGILKYFPPKNRFIHQRKTADQFIKKLPEKAVVVDDKIEVIEKLFSSKKFTPVWINREGQKDGRFRTINNLTELVQMFV